MKMLHAPLSLLCLTACLSQEPSANIYVLNAPPAAQDVTKIEKAIEVASPTAAPGLGTERIALKHSANTLDYYAGSRWPRPLPEVVQSALVKTLEQDGRFASVTNDETGTADDEIITILIQDFQAEYATKDSAPSIRVTLSTRISDAATHKILGSFVVSKNITAKANTMEEIIRAFHGALKQSLAEIAAKSSEILNTAPIPALPEEIKSR